MGDLFWVHCKEIEGERRESEWLERIEVDVCGGRKEKSDEQLGLRDRRRSEFVVEEVRKQFGELGEGEAEKECT